MQQYEIARAIEDAYVLLASEQSSARERRDQLIAATNSTRDQQLAALEHDHQQEVIAIRDSKKKELEFSREVLDDLTDMREYAVHLLGVRYPALASVLTRDRSKRLTNVRKEINIDDALQDIEDVVDEIADSRTFSRTQGFLLSVLAGIAVLVVAVWVGAQVAGLTDSAGNSESSAEFDPIIAIAFGVVGAALAGLVSISIAKRTIPERDLESELFPDLQQMLLEAQYWHDSEMAKVEEIYNLREAEAYAEFEKRRLDLEDKCEEQLEYVNTSWKRATNECHRVHEEAILGIRDELTAFVKSLPSFSLKVLEPVPDQWERSSLARPWPARVGSMHQIISDDVYEIPCFSGVLRQRSLLIEGFGASREIAIEMTRSTIVRALLGVEPGMMQFTFLDPVGLGQNVSGILDLSDYDEALVNSRAWTEQRHIEQRLADLTDTIETVIQRRLRNEFATIEEYNKNAGEIAEPYRVLVVMDFPVNFSEDAARRLLSIAQNGPRCGVYVIAHVDPSRKMPHGFNLDDLRRAMMVVRWDDEASVFRVVEEGLEEWRLEPDPLPDPETIRAIIKHVGEGAVKASNVEVPFSRIAPEASEHWSGDSSSGLEIPLGPSGARTIQRLNLGAGDAQHGLVVGRTGSGKSTLLHTVITNAALTYSPSELQLYLIDFKKGVEFKTYADKRLPHARVIAIESEREFGLSVLEGLDAEMTRRGELFRSLAVDDVAGYRKRVGNLDHAMPRLFLIVDEFQEFFTEDDELAGRAGNILDRLVRQGRAFGIHVLLGSQTLAGNYSLSRSTIDQMGVRIALMCSEADSRLILADDNPMARLLSRPGEAIYNDSNGRVEGNKEFQVAWLPDDERDRYLDQIRDRREPALDAFSTIVFEGNSPADMTTNRLLQHALQGNRTSTPGALAWLGDPIAIRDPIAAQFRRQSGSNLLIVGQRESEATGMVAATIVSLASQLPAPIDAPGDELRPFYVLDFGAYDADAPRALQDLTSEIPELFHFGRRRQAEGYIDELATVVQRRIDLLEGTLTADLQTQYDGPVYLFIFGLHRARDLRPDDSYGGFGSFDEEPVQSLAQKFEMILEDGPDVGVHTIAWCNSVTNLNRALDRRSLREFSMRVVMQMSAEDSANMVDTAAASRLGPHRALYYDEENGVLEKFRPYTTPANAWVHQSMDQIAGVIGLDYLPSERAADD